MWRHLLNQLVDGTSLVIATDPSGRNRSQCLCWLQFGDCKSYFQWRVHWNFCALESIFYGGIYGPHILKFLDRFWNCGVILKLDPFWNCGAILKLWSDSEILGRFWNCGVVLKLWSDSETLRDWEWRPNDNSWLMEIWRLATCGHGLHRSSISLNDILVVLQIQDRLFLYLGLCQPVERLSVSDVDMDGSCSLALAQMTACYAIISETNLHCSHLAALSASGASACAARCEQCRFVAQA